MKWFEKYYNLFVCEPHLHFVEELLVKVVIKNCFWVISAWQSFLACSCFLTSFSLNVLIKLLLYKKVCFNFLVPHNVGLLCSVVLGTFLCILGINYAMLTVLRKLAGTAVNNYFLLGHEKQSINFIYSHSIISVSYI